MPQIDLDEYGFEGKKFVYEGNLTSKKEGGKLLFLFAETHKEPTTIGPNACNCVRLVDEGVVGLRGELGGLVDLRRVRGDLVVSELPYGLTERVMLRR